MLAQLTASSAVPKALNVSHLLVLLPKNKTLPSDVSHHELLAAVLKRRAIKADEFTTPVAANAADGSLIAWAMLDSARSISRCRRRCAKPSSECPEVEYAVLLESEGHKFRRQHRKRSQEFYDQVGESSKTR